MTSLSLPERDLPVARRIYCGAETPANFAGVSSEFAALRQGCGVIETNWRVALTVSGEDRVRWLNGMLTNNIRDLAPGHGVYGYFLTPQGHIQGDGYAWNRGDSLAFVTDAEQWERLLAFLDHYIIMDDVTLVPATDWLASLAVQGPTAAVLSAVAIEFSLALPTLQPLQAVEIRWQNQAFTVLRLDSPSPAPRFEIWAAPAAIATLRNALLLAGATPVGADAYECWRIAAGIPQFGVDIRASDLPQSTNQDHRALHFTKGCYIGQEIVERIRSQGRVHRLFTGFRVEGSLPTPGTPIGGTERSLGVVTSATEVPTASGPQPIAIGYIRQELGPPGKQFIVEGATLTVTSLPFQSLMDTNSHPTGK